MKKCTLCIDRIYNQTISEAERVPACVATCPAHARHFDDANSAVSELVRSRGGYDLMLEMGYRSVNKYPPSRKNTCSAPALPEPAANGSGVGERLLAWLDRALSG